MSDDAPKKIHYEQSIGAIAILAEILPTPQWYKDNPRQVVLINRSYLACEALPDLPKRPKPDKDEDKDSFEARIDMWADPILEFEWTDKEKESVKTCVKFYMKQASFTITKHIISIFKLLDMEDE